MDKCKRLLLKNKYMYRLTAVIAAAATGMAFGLWQQNSDAGIFMWLLVLSLAIIKTVE